MPALKEIEKQAMHLDQADRALLADHLIVSLDSDGDVNAEQLWIKEVDKRYAAYQQGTISSRPADEVLTKARRSLK
jgi:hypothetical protein